jgi:magnesium transporter
MFQNLSTFEKLLSRAHGNYLAYLSVDSMLANNRVNSLLSKLTLLTVIIVPMNVITGLWGMNVHVPGQSAEGGYVGFICICLVILTWGTLFTFLMWRIGFFR